MYSSLSLRFLPCSQINYANEHLQYYFNLVSKKLMTQRSAIDKNEILILSAYSMFSNTSKMNTKRRASSGETLILWTIRVACNCLKLNRPACYVFWMICASK